MTGTQLATFTEELNGGASIGETLLFQFINLAKAMVEQRRPWMNLRDTDTSKTVTAATSAWQTAIDLTTIARFSRFYGDDPIKNFGGTNRIDNLHEVPWHRRLEYKDMINTFVFNHGTKQLYLNGSVAAGTLYIDHIKNSADIQNDASSEWSFPSWAHPLLGYMAVAMNKGGVDYDDLNARMAPENQARADAIIRQLENWDNELQLSSLNQFDPTDSDPGFRSGAINIH